MLSVRAVIHAYDRTPVLRGINLEVKQGEIVCLLGPSGCGKSTLLRLIVGLEQPDVGDIQVNGQSILSIPVHARDFGLMFQDFALFPHMNVRDNVRFGLRMRHVPPDAQETRLREVLELVGLSGFERRDVTILSGGEQQRVALARSLAPNPRLLLLDEPMGSLDATLRDRLLGDLRDIIKRVGLTAIYVTHDQSEAYAVADRVAIMNAGLIEQIDAPHVLYRRPATAFVARFLGLNNILPVLAQQGNLAQTELGAFRVEEQPVAILLHPDGITLSSADDPTAISVTVRQATFRGARVQLQVKSEGGTNLSFAIPSDVFIPRIGERVLLEIDSHAVVPLAKL